MQRDRVLTLRKSFAIVSTMPPSPDGQCHRSNTIAERLRAAWRGRAWGVAAGLALLLGAPLPAQTGKAPRSSFPDSIVEVPAATAADQHRGRIVRTALSQAESAATMEIEVALRMRNFAELQARVQRGEIISRDEMAAKYFPLAADYEKVVAWLAAQGLDVTRADSTRLSVFVRANTSRLKDVFEVNFARVATEGGEFTSAITAPTMPTSLAPALLGINGLQPHLRPHKMTAAQEVRPLSLTSNAPPYIPSQILKAYNANALNLTGAGQTIAIVIDTFPADSDLTTFWSRCNISQSLSNIQKIQVISGSLASADPTEATIDVELTSSIAPAAKIRVYATTELYQPYLTQAYQRVYDDLATNPGLHQVDLSFGINEDQTTYSQRQSDAQHFTALAGAGVTIFASSGDGGSNPNADPHSDNDYSSSARAQPQHPASDPSVTGVGATTLTLDSSTGAEVSETGWSVGRTANGLAASGGGASLFFSRPDWQTGTGVGSGSMRMVPDVAVVGDPATGCYIVINGSADQFGGTSISAPIWAGFGALINQARASAGLPPLGLLGPKIYPLIGTTGLRDITSGNNGLYSAGAGYDMVTGVGAPNMAALVPALAPQTGPPQVVTPPASQTVMPGTSATFTVAASGAPPLAYQWQRQAALLNSATWSNLANDTTYSGATTATLTVNSATLAMNGDLFQCVITNVNGTATTAPPVALIVTNPLAISTLAGLAGNAGTADGTGSAARFNGPCDLAVDSAGNLLVADTNNDAIRKITSAGVVTTLAGQAGVSGSTDGTGSAARFNSPTGITVDGSGNVYVADTNNHTIRKITPAGVVSTVAGQAGTAGAADGTGSAAAFNFPSDVAVDGSGNVYVADTNNHAIRKITSAGAVSTFAGSLGIAGSANGTGAAARFSSPEGVAVDSTGTLYVADTDNQTIRKISPAGVVSTVAGLAGTSGSADGADSSARFQYPSDLALDGTGNLYVADTDNHVLRKVTSTGLTATVAGLAGTSGSADGAGTAARFYYPTGVTVDGAGNVYVADTSNHLIRKGATVAAPQITTQPQSQTAAVGANVTFTVQATGVPAPIYQWYKDTLSVGGATSATFTLSNVQSSNAGSYTVVVSNVAGSVTSSAATLTVNAVSTPAASTGSSGGGGGGGALPAWFVLALALLGAARRATMSKRTSRSG
jgi:kumamolisin